MQIVLSRFWSINAWNTKIGLAFIPVAVAAVVMGPLAGGMVGALGDFIGAIMFPIGPYFPGFTLTAFLSGVTFGLLLRKKGNLPGLVSAVLIDQLLLSFLLNSLFISFLYGSPLKGLMVTRITQCLIVGAAELIVLYFMDKTPLRSLARHIR